MPAAGEVWQGTTPAADRGVLVRSFAIVPSSFTGSPLPIMLPPSTEALCSRALQQAFARCAGEWKDCLHGAMAAPPRCNAMQAVAAGVLAAH